MLKIQNLVKSYEDTTVVDDVTLDIPHGKVVSMTGFGASGPAASLFEKFGFTTENVVAAVKSVL